MTTYLLQEFLAELVVSRHEKRDSQLMELNEMPLYPTEVRPTAQFMFPESLYGTQRLVLRG